VLKGLERVASWAAWAGGLVLLGVAFFVALEVILRKVFLIGLSAAADLSGYALAISYAWGLSFALARRAHVRVDALIRLFPRKVCRLFDVLALLALTWLAAVMAWYGYGVFAESLARGARAMTPLATPMWIPQGLWVIGLAGFLVSCAVFVVFAVRALLAGRTAEVNRLIGTLTPEEEAEAEIRAARSSLGPDKGSQA